MSSPAGSSGSSHRSTVADQPAAAASSIRRARALGRPLRVVELGHASGIGPDAFTFRNHLLVDHCDFVIGFPAASTEDGSGTWETLNYARSLDRPVLVVPVGAAG